ncbi:MAG: hypothetical protein DI586_01030 [Micavibrio aeruginosavorus]|uniref:Uncharacterized protein n=1 Tax=Micavibrio aeruginosavorus TaxID=349221 RepID=A0A2W5FMK5_9BACT|nr:MAG: hypothetical protein DI586_01030 [Micavibrio aeruginosavorus]
MALVDLDQFPEDTYRTLIALPYRVGLYVSQSDRTGGKSSETQELAALENVVTFYVEDTLKSEFAQTIMLATLQHKAYWPEWSAETESVPQECKTITDYLVNIIDERKLESFKSNLLEIAITVAQAYQESAQDVSIFGKIKHALSFRSEKIAADDNIEHINISAAEKIAINKLAEMMGVAQRVA